MTDDRDPREHVRDMTRTRTAPRPTSQAAARPQRVTRPGLGERDAPPATPWARVESPGSGANVTNRINDRLAERAKAQARLRWRTVGRRLGFAGAGLLLVWLVAMSPVFALHPDKVEVSGYGNVVDAQQVNATIASHEGTSLALLNTGHLANQLTDVPGVREVAIERVWPAGLVVTLTPREPVAAIPDQAGGFIFVDEEAVELGRSEETPPHLPVIEVPLGPDNVRVLDSVLGVVHELPVSLRDRVEGIRAKTEDSVTFTLRDGPHIEWGSAEQSALKAEVLAVLLDSPEAATAEVIDVSAPTLPITRAED